MMTREDPMKRRKATGLERLRRRITRLDAHSIDRLYGLEPVWEPGAAAAHVAPELFVAGRCPYCGARLGGRVDLTPREPGYGADCGVLWHPVRLPIERDAAPCLSDFQ